MNNSITINNQNVLVKQYKGQRVLTFKDIDIVHGRADGTAGRNFRVNRERFIEGEDYYKITPDEFRRTIAPMDKRQANDVTVITESGYLMLVKSFTDDLSWMVQRQLVNNYFRFKETKVTDKQLEFYNYFDKKYEGEPVLSSMDVSHFTNINYSVVDWYARTYLSKGTDYYYLKGEELRSFKQENPQVSKLSSAVVIFAHSGFDKFCKAYSIEVETPKLFIEEKKQELPKRDVVILPSNAMKSLMGYVQHETKAIEGISHLMLTRDTKENLNNYRKLLNKRIKDLGAYCLDIQTIKI